MKNSQIKLICILPIFIGMIALLNGCNESNKMITVIPKIKVGPVLNPGKGWVYYGSPDLQNKKEEVDLASVGYRSFEWRLIEPQEGEYNWAPLDSFINEWSSLGKQVAFGIMAASTHSNAPDGYVTPKWVYDSGVKDRRWNLDIQGDRAKGRSGLKREPADWEDPILLSKVENFVEALAKRYDSSPHIAFIDIRTAYNWGETMNKKHVLIWRKHFHQTLLCQSTHVKEVEEGLTPNQIAAWQHNFLDKAQEQTRWCVDLGIAVRRDGIGGSMGEELIPAAGKVPAIFEFWGTISYLKEQGWWKDGKLMPEAIEIGKPTFVELCRNSPELLAEYHELVDTVINRIGFHFILEELQYNKKLITLEALNLKCKWINKGVSRIFSPCILKVALVNENSQIVAVADVDNSHPDTWLPDISVEEVSQVQFSGDIEKGDYQFAIGLFRSKDDLKPHYSIGIDTPLLEGWHIVGPLKVE